MLVFSPRLLRVPCLLPSPRIPKALPQKMEAMRMKLFFFVVAVLATVSAVSAADSPAPGPTSDATAIFVPTAVASLVALALGILF